MESKVTCICVRLYCCLNHCYSADLPTGLNYFYFWIEAQREFERLFAASVEEPASEAFVVLDVGDLRRWQRCCRRHMLTSFEAGKGGLGRILRVRKKWEGAAAEEVRLRVE